MKRRDILRYSTAATVVPAVVGAQQRRQQAAPPGTPPKPTTASPASWKSKTFTPAQNDTVIALTDLILPATDTAGAKEAKVNQYIDLFLTDGPEGERTRFLEGLAWLDEYAQKKHGRPFAKLTADQQTALLTVLDQKTEPDIERGHEFFRMAKSMTARIYYNTAAGFREMNKGGRVPRTFGCEHTEHKAG